MTPHKKKKVKVRTFETFRELGDWEIRNIQQESPSSFNGIVQVEKYRVTIEKIDEPKEVYAERLQKLWEEGDNHHHYAPIEGVAKKFGVKLVGRFGEKRVKK